MKAEETFDVVAKENGYHNYADVLVLGNPHYIRLISRLSAERYARLMIEKDRERVKANVVMKHHCGTTKKDKPIDYYQNGVDNIQVDLDSIDQTPIELD